MYIHDRNILNVEEVNNITTLFEIEEIHGNKTHYIIYAFNINEVVNGIKNNVFKSVIIKNNFGVKTDNFTCNATIKDVYNSISLNNDMLACYSLTHLNKR